MFYESLMLIVLVLFVLVIVLACVGFGTVARWLLRRKRPSRSPAGRSFAASSSPTVSEANAPRLDTSSDDFVFEPERTETSGASLPVVSPSSEDAVDASQADSKNSWKAR